MPSETRTESFRLPRPHIVEGGIPTEALLAQIAISKYADGLPLYRKEAIYARVKVELDRKLMALPMGKLGFELDILADYILAEIKKAERIFADDNVAHARAWMRIGQDGMALDLCTR